MNWPVGIDPTPPDDDPVAHYRDLARAEVDWLWPVFQMDERAIDALQNYLTALVNHRGRDEAEGELLLVLEALIDERAQTEYDGRFDL